MADSITKGMRFDVAAIKEGEDVLFNIPELKRIESWNNYPGTPGGELNKDMVVRYMIYMYSVDSILVKKNPPLALSERKMRAAELAGFERDKKGKFNHNIEFKLFDTCSEWVVDMIVDYLIFQKHHVWTEICTTEQEYAEYIKLRFAPVEDEKDKDTLLAAEKKNKLRDSCKSMIKDLESYYIEFFKDNSDVKSKADKAVRTTLENLAK